MADLELSLDEIIKKRMIKNPVVLKKFNNNKRKSKSGKPKPQVENMKQNKRKRDARVKVTTNRLRQQIIQCLSTTRKVARQHLLNLRRNISHFGQQFNPATGPSGQSSRRPLIDTQNKKLSSSRPSFTSAFKDDLINTFRSDCYSKVKHQHKGILKRPFSSNRDQNKPSSQTFNSKTLEEEEVNHGCLELCLNENENAEFTFEMEKLNLNKGRHVSFSHQYDDFDNEEDFPDSANKRVHSKIVRPARDIVHSHLSERQPLRTALRSTNIRQPLEKSINLNSNVLRNSLHNKEPTSLSNLFKM